MGGVWRILERTAVLLAMISFSVACAVAGFVVGLVDVPRRAKVASCVALCCASLLGSVLAFLGVLSRRNGWSDPLHGVKRTHLNQQAAVARRARLNAMK